MLPLMLMNLVVISEVVFENPTHDFPQRITYRATESGLSARG